MLTYHTELKTNEAFDAVMAECIHSVNPGMKSSGLLGSLLPSNCEHASFSAVNISVILHSL